jgi:3-hydroxy acid dehydrogenase / malonic semialdehyde reductase
MADFKDKIVFISGASSGIGRSCATAFAGNGARLILCARSIDGLNVLAAELKEKYGTDVLAIGLDVRMKSSVKDAVDGLPEKWKKIDILVNNAGLARGLDKIHEGDTEDWDEMIDTNIKGLLYLTRSVVPLMIGNNSGHIINMGSVAGISAYQKGAVYCATKAAVRFISDGLRMELVDKPIRVTNIQPGLVTTNFGIVRFHGDKEKSEDFYRGIRPLSPDDVADAVIYAASAPPNVQISEITLMPVHQASASVSYRESSK